MKSKDFWKKQSDRNPELRNEYFRRNLALDISHKIMRERARRGLTQRALAELIGTKQSGIARAERGVSLPKLDLLDRIAGALGLTLDLGFKDNSTKATDHSAPGIIKPARRSPYFQVDTSAVVAHSESREFEK